LEQFFNLKEAPIMRYAFTALAATLIMLGVAGTTANAQGVYPSRTPNGDVQLVDSWYRHFLGRPVDDVGLQSWLPVLASGNAEAGILGSGEYLSRHGGTADGFVTGLYVDVLGRQPAAAEVQGWLNRLPQLGWDRTALADEFLRAAATEISLRNQPQLPSGYQPVVPQIVEQPLALPYNPPVVVYGSSWDGGGYRPGYWGGIRSWGGGRPWFVSRYRGEHGRGGYGGGHYSESRHGHR
jgi:hypothetical protein